ncbi:MAG: FKBP-type peptidyl-prolyl cis-trans isomerase [Dysgonamonadaceae bacterium]|jgi:FKBP-type peptidyl-prolyl cis-trans isomerase|nr:FKBP-type peptidyl-prolyl cis-trans isomerase [Dysgonamonadaceae bacterium]
MKNLIYFLPLSLLTILFTGCNKSEVDEAWREANGNYYEQIKQNPEYEELKTATGPTGVYRKRLEGDTILVKQYPLQTSSVKVLYLGKYYDGTVFDEGSGTTIPTEFNLTGGNVIRGFSFALQQMCVGNRWEIVIPYYLGYGESGLVSDYTTLIEGYTTLVFEVELVEIIRYPQ